MSFADWVPTIIRGVMLACWFILGVYVVRVFIFILFHGEEGRRMREAMAVGYTMVAAYFIFNATKAIPNFVQRIVGDAGSIGSTTSAINTLLVICSVVICAAFICNFSRSLWMLKNLDHAVFEPVPEWEQLSTPKFKRIFEFFTRMGAALLFIYLEFKLEKVAHVQGVTDVGLIAHGSPPTRPLSQAGFVAIFLYLVLILWWFSGKLIAGSQMPKLLFFFFLFGFLNSTFIYAFADEPVDESSKIWLLICVGVCGLLASSMIIYVLWDLFKLLKGLFKPSATAAGT